MRDATIREIKPEDSGRVAELLTQLGYPVNADEVAQRLAYWLDDFAHYLDVDSSVRERVWYRLEREGMASIAEALGNR